MGSQCRDILFNNRCVYCLVVGSVTELRKSNPSDDAGESSQEDGRIEHLADPEMQQRGGGGVRRRDRGRTSPRERLLQARHPIQNSVKVIGI